MKVKLRINIIDLTTIIILLWFINPMSMDFYNWSILASIVIIWMLLALYDNSAVFVKSVCNVPMFLYGLFLIILGLYALLGHCPFYLQSLSIPFAYVLSQFSLNARNKNNKKKILLFVYLYIFVIAFNTIFQLFTNPNLSRYLAGGNSELTRTIASPFSGGYSFIYISVFLTVSAFANYLISNVDRNEEKDLFCLIQLVSGFVLIILAQYTTALLLTSLGVFLSIMIAPTKPRAKFAGATIVFIIAIIIFSGILPSVIVSIAKFFPPGQMQDHIYELAMVARYGSDSANDLTRIKILKSTMELFFTNPFFGAGYSHNHQEFFDCFAQYGLFGAVPYFASIFLMLKKTISTFRMNKYKMAVIIPTLIFIVFLFLNSAGDGALYFTILFIIPETILCKHEISR